jgi:NTE family protein
MWRDHDALFLSGGGLKVASFLGALELYDLASCREVYGVSAGSMLACMLAVGYSAEAAQRRFRETPWPSIFFEACTLGRLARGMALLDPARLRSVLEGLLQEAGVPAGATLGWLRRRRPAAKHFGCIVADADAGELLLLGRPGDAAHDRLRLTEMVLASMALPGVLDPVELGGRRLVDAGIVNNAPLSLLPPRRPGRRLLALVLGTRFPRETLLTSPAALLWLKCNFLTHAEVLAAEAAAVTVVQMPQPPEEVGLLRVSEEGFATLLRQGRAAAVAWRLRAELAGCCVLLVRLAPTTAGKASRRSFPSPRAARLEGERGADGRGARARAGARLGGHGGPRCRDEAPGTLLARCRALGHSALAALLGLVG